MVERIFLPHLRSSRKLSHGNTRCACSRRWLSSMSRRAVRLQWLARPRPNRTLDSPPCSIIRASGHRPFSLHTRGLRLALSLSLKGAENSQVPLRFEIVEGIFVERFSALSIQSRSIAWIIIHSRASTSLGIIEIMILSDQIRSRSPRSVE